MIFTLLPPLGAWRLLGAHDGFEITQFVTKKGDNITLNGTSLGIESGTPWNFHYTIDLDPSWHIRSAVIDNTDGDRLDIQADGVGHWTINGKRRPDLDNCLDLDLEGSVVTNTAPIHRLALEVNQKSDAPAAYVRTQNLRIERLEQTYQRLADSENLAVFDYNSPRFDYHNLLRFAPDGLIVDYPSIGARVL
jgi:uncharacterized protein